MNHLPTLGKIDDLCQDALSCRACSKMSFGRTFLNEHNGPWDADVMVIGESTNVGTDDQLAKPMWDSPSGRNLNKLLASAGLSREEVFVTNTVLHTPVMIAGENPSRTRYVTEKEQENCASFLSRQIEIVNPRVICTLGNKALLGLKFSVEHHLSLKHDVGKVFPIPNERWLIPLYHPSPNVIASWRSFSQQVEDYQIISKSLELIRIHEAGPALI